MSSLTPLSFASAALIAGLVAAHLAAGWRGGARGLWLIGLLLVTVGWAVSVCVGATRWVGVADILRQLTVLGLLGAWLGARWWRACGPWALLGAAVLVAGLVLALGSPSQEGLPLWHLLAAVAGLVGLEQVWRNSPPESRWGIKPLVLGVCGLMAFDVYVFAQTVLLSGVDFTVWAMRGAVSALCVPLMWLTAARMPHGLSAVTLSRRVVFHSAALAGCGGYFLLVSAAGFYVRDFGGRWGPALQVLLGFAAALGLVLAAASGRVRSWLRLAIAKHFFTLRYDYRELWLGFTRALTESDNAQDACERVTRALGNLVDARGGALWWRDEDDGGRFTQRARWNVPRDDVGEPEESAFFAQHPPLDLVECPHEGLGVVAHIPDAWLVLPLARGARWQGFVVLRQARVAQRVDWELRDLLRAACAQAASDLDRWQAFDALLTARQFEATSRMTTYVLHELKNQASDLSLMLSNATRHSAKPEFQQDLLHTVEHVAARLRHLIDTLRGAGRKASPQPVALRPLLEHLVGAAQHKSPAPVLRIEHDCSVRADATQLARVMGHLLQNAIDATDSNGRVWVNLRRDRHQAVIDIHDTGVGMSPEFVREKLFKPFSSTKPQGMGIGAYECDQYVRSLGGAIEVCSTPGEGTRMSVSLALCESVEACVPDRAAA